MAPNRSNMLSYDDKGSSPSFQFSSFLGSRPCTVSGEFSAWLVSFGIRSAKAVPICVSGRVVAKRRTNKMK